MRNMELEDMMLVRRENNWKKEMAVKKKARWELLKSIDKKYSFSDVYEKKQEIYKIWELS